MRIVKIGAITLDNVMWVSEGSDSSGVVTEVVNNLDGGIIIFEQPKRTSKQNITLLSKDNGWQSVLTSEAILAMANSSIGTTFIVENDSGATFNARFRHEQAKGAVQFKRLVDAKLSEWYTGTIYLAKV